MVDRSYTIRKGINGIYFRVEFGEAVVSNTNTVTFSNFTTATALLNAVFWQKSNGALLASTLGASNVVTINAGADVPVVYMVYGVKA